MTNNRRYFLKKAGWVSATAFMSSFSWARDLDRALYAVKDMNADELAGEEDFWTVIQQSFTGSPNMINLNNGGVSPAPKMVQEAMKKNYDFSNEIPSFNMWRTLDMGREPLRQNLARLAGCDAEEIVINRNSSEGLETVIFGLTLKSGEEVVASKQDYPNAINAYRQREMRDGIKVNWVNLELPSEDEEYLVKQYVDAFTERTKLVHITHVINWNGQIIPVRRIAQEAHKRGIEVLVDGAHSFAQLDFKIPDLDADYYATSLHKWLYAPIGSGMLFVKKDKIKTVYPLFATDKHPLKDDIRKFEHLGTRPFFIEQAIGKAIEFHDRIGIQRKQKRLHYLKNYWMEGVKNIPGISVRTSMDPRWGCAIGNVIGKDDKPGEMDKFLFDEFRVHTVPIVWENIHGVRITPNVYTTISQLDVLIKAIAAYAKKL